MRPSHQLFIILVLRRDFSRMSALEGRFEQLIQREGKDVNQFKALVKENGKIQEEIKASTLLYGEDSCSFWLVQFLEEKSVILTLPGVVQPPF